MKAWKAILVMLFIAGLAGIGYAAGELHTGALGTEWARHLRGKLETARKLPDFRDPSAVGGLSYERALGDLEDLAYKRAHLAGVCLLACAGIVVLSGTELWRLLGAPPRGGVTSPRSPH